MNHILLLDIISRHVTFSVSSAPRAVQPQICRWFSPYFGAL